MHIDRFALKRFFWSKPLANFTAEGTCRCKCHTGFVRTLEICDVSTFFPDLFYHGISTQQAYENSPVQCKKVERIFRVTSLGLAQAKKENPPKPRVFKRYCVEGYVCDIRQAMIIMMIMMMRLMMITLKMMMMMMIMVIIIMMIMMMIGMMKIMMAIMVMNMMTM